MAFAYTNSKGQTYYLHGREVELNNDLTRTIYFFAKDQRQGVLDSVPAGWQVMEGRNALPVLSKEDADRGNGGSRSSRNGGSSRGSNSRGGSSRGNGGGSSGDGGKRGRSGNRS